MGVSMKIVPDNGTELSPCLLVSTSVVDEIHRSEMKQLRRSGEVRTREWAWVNGCCSQIGVVDRTKDCIRSIKEKRCKIYVSSQS